jgi:hypothetical protein
VRVILVQDKPQGFGPPGFGDDRLW